MVPAELSLMQDCKKPCSSYCNCGSTPECASPIEQKMQQYLAEQLELCHELEAIADGLPNNFDRQKLLIVARNILPTIKAAHHFEEYRIFPHILIEAERREALKHSLERLKFEHWEDESFAEELSHGLISFVAEQEEPSSITLAYMLRGFFEGMRRHIAFESEHILPLLQRQGSTSN